MHVLIVKTSSMGDVIHTLPALTDAKLQIPTIKFDWLVEEAFAEIPTWHPAVNEVIPIAFRQWRKNILASEARTQLKNLRTLLRKKKYDFILDAQGLVKSAWLTRFANAKRVGLDWQSAREPLASIFYHKKCNVNFKQHAVIRARELFSKAFDYPFPQTPQNFAIDKTQFHDDERREKPYLVFLHGTTWTSKMWPENYWIELAKLAELSGFNVKISGGSDAELARAERIAKAVSCVEKLPRQTIGSMAKLLANADGAIAVDTGFGHLAGALGIPTLSLFGATNPALTGVLGTHAKNLLTPFACSPCLHRTCQFKNQIVMPPCYSTLPATKVWQTFEGMIGEM